jgi:hypothetical protein
MFVFKSEMGVLSFHEEMRDMVEYLACGAWFIQGWWNIGDFQTNQN